MLVAEGRRRTGREQWCQGLDESPGRGGVAPTFCGVSRLIRNSLFSSLRAGDKRAFLIRTILPGTYLVLDYQVLILIIVSPL